MPVRSIANQYRGVNAHLHSVLQGQRGWNNFHNPHITYLNNALQALLRPLGYETEIEDSVQVRRANDYVRVVRSDTSVYDRQPEQRTGYPNRADLTGVLVPFRALYEAVEADDNPLLDTPYRAIAITRADAPGQLVAWVELLSPSNKARGDDRETYLTKREDLFDSGIVIVEVDYLHELPPTVPIVGNYRAGDSAARPYHILVLDPRPTKDEGVISINGFDVDEPIPTVTIPLSGGDTIALDFNAPYQQHLTDQQLTDRYVDYADLPPNFDRYRPDDQARIARRMLAVLQASQRGDDLDAGVPFPVDAALTLTDALAQLRAFAR